MFWKARERTQGHHKNLNKARNQNKQIPGDMQRKLVPTNKHKDKTRHQTNARTINERTGNKRESKGRPPEQRRGKRRRRRRRAHGPEQLAKGKRGRAVRNECRRRTRRHYVEGAGQGSGPRAGAREGERERATYINKYMNHVAAVHEGKGTNPESGGRENGTQKGRRGER